MPTTIKLGEEVTIGTTPTEYVIYDPNFKLPQPFQDILITVDSANSGTIKFSVGETPPAAQKAWAADSKLAITISNGNNWNLWAVASTAGQKFTPS